MLGKGNITDLYDVDLKTVLGRGHYAVVNLGRSLGKRIVAEGIETVEQLAAVKALGVHVGQGYLLSRPLRAEQVAALLGQVVAEPG